MFLKYTVLLLCIHISFFSAFQISDVNTENNSNSSNVARYRRNAILGKKKFSKGENYEETVWKENHFKFLFHRQKTKMKNVVERHWKKMDDQCVPVRTLASQNVIMDINFQMARTKWNWFVMKMNGNCKDLVDSKKSSVNVRKHWWLKLGFFFF